MEDVERKQKSHQALLIAISGLGSLSTLVIIHVFLRTWFSAINIVGGVHIIFSIYFFYQIFDLAEKQLLPRLRHRVLRFFFEFLKILASLFIATTEQFYFIHRPLLNQNYEPDFFLLILATSIPAAAIARIMFDLRQAREVAIQSRLAQAEAQYNLLEAQMQPHFLFNSLNVLSELIYVDPDMACSVTQQLADLYREILTNSKKNFSNLGSEISILKKYIQIQKIRFGDRIRFKCDVGAELFDVSVPSLILQTLVENAIKHGISPRQEGGDIELTVTPIPGAQWDGDNTMFEICVANTGELYKGPKNKDLGTGLQNTKNRLDLFYGRSHGFSIQSDDKKTYVRFKVPQQGDLRQENLI